MRYSQQLKTVCIAVLACALIGETALAQRGRGGDRGQRGQGEARQGQGSRSGGNQGRGNVSQGREGAARGVPGRSRGAERTQPQERRSNYRGPDFDQSDVRQRERGFDRVQSGSGVDDRARRSEGARDPSQQFERQVREGRESLDRDWRDEFFGDRARDDRRFDDRVDDRRFDDDRFDEDRFQGDRDRWDRDRIDWDRRADRIRRDWSGWNRGDLPFRYGWWDNYSGTWPVYSPWRYSRWNDRPYYWWGWTPAARLGTWLAFNWGRPYYWGYGPGSNIYYRDNYVYYDDRRVMPADDYYQYVYDIAHDVPSVDADQAEQMDWSPLGVFAVTRANEGESHRVLQLAVNKEGVISGTYYNRENGHIHPVLGRVDDRTQRAAWAFADGEHEEIVFETSIYNLTNNETSMMVHFGRASQDAEVWQLVRLEQPEASESGSESLPSPRVSRSLP